MVLVVSSRHNGPDSGRVVRKPEIGRLLQGSSSSVEKTVARVIGVRIFLEQELWGINEVSFVRFVHGALAGSLAKRGARIQKPSSIHALLPEVEWR
jgi:hypothetical protein